MRAEGSRTATGLVATVLLGLLAGLPAVAGPPPAGGTYFTVFLGLDGPYLEGAECLRFTAKRVCTSRGLCGTWERLEAAGRETSIAFSFAFEDDLGPVEIDGRARINTSGKRDSLAAAAMMSAAGERFNFGFAGRSTGPRNCLRLWADWSRQNPPPQAEQDAACLTRARFAAPSGAEYILPYPAGREYRVSQTYCYAHAGHATQLAYDFDTPVGSRVIAARGGVVRRVRQDLPDNGASGGVGDHNHVYIEHDDGTVGFYAHLQQDSLLVAVDDRVETGQPIASNGFSGDIGEPHLHFGVYRSWPVQEGDDLPVGFRNAVGPLDERGGLISGVFYRATATAEP